jgi:endonuclease-3 related protein
MSAAAQREPKGQRESKGRGTHHRRRANAPTTRKGNLATAIYDDLLRSYGPQGWWPLLECEGINPTKTGSVQGYHPGDYSFPRNDRERFEICIGAILTQNTAWPNVEKALLNLQAARALEPKRILSLGEQELGGLIKPAGYFNQKARKLKVFSEFYIALNGRTPGREELLDLWGIGPETADSMLLYAFRVPTFVVDAYTRRIFSNLRHIPENAAYDEVKSYFEQSLKPDLAVYQEYHALIVEHAKRHYGRGMNPALCPMYLRYAQGCGKR